MSSYVTDFFHPCYLYVLFGEVPLKVSAAAAAKLLQSCPSLCNPRDGSPPGSPVLGILQARTLEWPFLKFGCLLIFKMY